MPKFEFVSNMSALIRDDEFDGVSYKVAPVVLIAEGVHNGLYYPESELAKFPQAWNARPVPVYHPTDLEGDSISAATPESIEQHCIGMVFNVSWDTDSKKLKGEIWINEAKAKLLEGGRLVLKMLADEKMIEVSTGLFLEVVAEEGVWNNEAYVGIAVNYRPDHLALLPGRKGACSIEDGAGTPRTNEQHGTKKPRMFTRVVEALKGFFKPTTNDASLDRRRDDLRSALMERYVDNSTDSWLWVEDLREESIVYCLEVSGSTPKFFSIGYSVSEDGSVSLSDVEPMEVKMVVDYKPVQNQEAQQMDRVKVIAELITNGTFEEGDRPFLEGLADDRLGAFVALKTDVTPPAPKEPKKEEPKKEVSATNAKPVVEGEMSEDEFLARVPAKFRGILVNGAHSVEQKRNSLAKALVGNARCRLSEDALKAMDLATLEAMAEMAQVTVSYEGADPGETVQTNESAPAPMPGWDWTKDQKAEA